MLPGIACLGGCCLLMKSDEIVGKTFVAQIMKSIQGFEMPTFEAKLRKAEKPRKDRQGHALAAPQSIVWPEFTKSRSA